MDLITLVLLDYRKTAKECGKKLETEENNNKLATLQGVLSSCKLFLDTFKNGFSSSSFYDEWDLEDQEMPHLEKITDKQISELEKQRLMLEGDEGWHKFIQVFIRATDSKKNWLFSSAEKGRDLIFVHGWRDGLKLHETLFNQVEWEYERRLEENSLFADDLEMKDAGQVVKPLEFSEKFLIEDNSVIDVEFEGAEDE